MATSKTPGTKGHSGEAPLAAGSRFFLFVFMGVIIRTYDGAQATYFAKMVVAAIFDLGRCFPSAGCGLYFLAFMGALLWLMFLMANARCFVHLGPNLVLAAAEGAGLAMVTASYLTSHVPLATWPAPRIWSAVFIGKRPCRCRWRACRPHWLLMRFLHDDGFGFLPDRRLRAKAGGTAGKDFDEEISAVGCAQILAALRGILADGGRLCGGLSARPSTRWRGWHGGGGYASQGD